MERKLLSLPSFFVLLLIAGIAFLATPVEDVQAALTGGNDITVVRKVGTGSGAVRSGNAVFTINFETEAVKVAGEKVNPTATAISKADGFGVEDILVTIVTRVPTASTTTRSPTAAEFKKAATETTAGEGQNFEVTIAVPSEGEGTITVSLRAFDAGDVEFEEADAPAMTYDETAPANLVKGSITYDTRNHKPTVTVEPLEDDGTTARTQANAASFLVKFTIADPGAVSGSFTADASVTGFTATPSFTAADIDILNGVVNSVGRVTKATTPANTYTVEAYVKANSGAPSVVIGVKAGVVTDKGGAGNVAIPATLNTAGDGAKDANAKFVRVDTVAPMVAISTTETLANPAAAKSKTNLVTKIAVTFTIQEPTAPTTTTPTPAPTTLLLADLGGADAAAAERLNYGTTPATQDITVTGGTLSGFQFKPAQFEAIYMATITPNDTAEEVVIGVKADAVKDIAGNGNAAPDAVTVDTGYEPDAVVTPESTEYGTLVTRLGASVIQVSLNVPANSFVVLARSDTTADNGISGLARVTDPDVGIISTTEIIDIKDNVWQDLSSFMGVGPGGAIDLLAVTGAATDGDLVISEIMWGSDDGLGSGATIENRANSQWIELYNTTNAAINRVVELRFTKSGTGAGVTNPQLFDKFTNFGLTQSNQYWAIPDTDGGAYGQGGRTSSSGSNIGTIRRLISMERKIDFVKVETATNDRPKQLEGVPAGDLASSWQASKDPQGANLSGRRLGTPGAKPFVTVGTTSISGSVVFNEIANRSNKKFDWIELYNPGTADVKINNWVLSKVTAIDKDDELVKFESDENIVVPSKGFLLVVNEDPTDTALAAGKNIDNPRSKANGLPTEFYIHSGLDIPKDKFLLVLRTESKLKSHEKIVDIAGNLGGLDLNHSPSATEVWPLRAWKRIKDDDLGENDSNTWRRDKGKNLYHADAWKSDGGFTGLGIDRNPESDEGPTSGTPGFDNGAIKDKVKDLTAKDPVVISEIMFGRGGTSNRPNPQWIELFNPSKTQAVKLNAWRLEIQNITVDPEENLNVDSNYTLILPDKLIQPNQTLLIVSASAREATRDRFPAERTINVWSTRKLRETVEMTSPRDAILSSVAFYIKLSDPDKVLVDEVGNIVRPRDLPSWDLPGGDLEEGGRASMIRREGTFGDGTEADAWISAAVVESGEKVSINEVYYGDASDLGTPGYRQGGPVPVQLASFYSKRNDAGAVVITWSTESELDNAGFNILRSMSRTGEFTRINAQLIPGAGTTGEKNTYTWTDTSARPNVVYYYQIEDVSLEGEHRTLRTTRLRGHVGAAGKATVIWGELKSRK